MDKGKSNKSELQNDAMNKELKLIYDHNKASNATSAKSQILVASSKSNNAPNPPTSQQQLKNQEQYQREQQSATMYSETSDNFNNESVFNANNYILNEVYLNEDLSLLPVVDEKSLLGCIKNKFETKKYYVTFFWIALKLKVFLFYFYHF